MTGTVYDFFTYPLKGARGSSPHVLVIHPDVGVKNDRRYALRKVAGDLKEWASKPNFYVCMNTPRMAAETPIFMAGLHDGINKLDRRYLRELGGRLRVKDEVQLQDTDGAYNLCDTKGAFVSFLNLASLKVLSERMGEEVDARRFRMNVLLEGLEPFEELTWVDTFPGTREIQIGYCRFRVDDACERCRAPEANPETGEYDLKILKALHAMMKERGYKSPHRGVATVMGILGQPLNAAVLHRGDPIKII